MTTVPTTSEWWEPRTEGLARWRLGKGARQVRSAGPVYTEPSPALWRNTRALHPVELPRVDRPCAVESTSMPKTWGLTKEQAGYRPAPKPEVRCDHCEFMFPRTSRGTCKYVRGLIKASYTCNEFSPREGSARFPA